MALVFDPNVFVLGMAAGVLGLLTLLSLIVAYAYRELSLAALAGYTTLLVLLQFIGQRAEYALPLQNVLLVLGPLLLSGLQIRLFKKRSVNRVERILVWLQPVAGVSFLAWLGWVALSHSVSAATVPASIKAEAAYWTAALGVLWGCLVSVSLAVVGLKSRLTSGPWKWWFLVGHAAGLLVSVFFLTNLADATAVYWPVALMLLVQVPPVYLSLVWRSRLLNEAQLRSTSAGSVDPLTGLATAPLLIERLMRIMARPQAAKPGQTISALYVIEVQNWDGMLAELGVGASETLQLEAALRLRRSVGDDDIVARISGGRFAVVAQDLADENDVRSMASRLVVSGLRTDSTQLPGLEVKFRILVVNLKLSTPLTLAAAQDWLDSICSRFKTWPARHVSRSFLLIKNDYQLNERFEASSSY